MLTGFMIGWATSAFAADNPVRTIQSSTGQFLVRGLVTPDKSSDASLTEPVSLTNSPIVDLDPNLLAISCERIKQALLRELNLPDAWRGQINVLINPVMASNQPPVIGIKVYADGWQYQIEMPRRIHKLKLVRGIVQVLLMEIANRNAGTRSAEIPLWLSEGLSHQLIESTPTDLVVSRPQFNVNNLNVSWLNRQGVRHDPLADVRERLSTHAAISFTKLGDPLPDQMPEETWKTYQACAQLFVNQLLSLNGGRQALLRMLFLLPHYLNWQSAFLTAFQPIFPGLIDVEKWWAVVLVNFTGLDPMNAWSREVAAGKLDDVLHPPVLVSTAPNNLPHRSRLSLQQIISQWDYLRQRILLKQLIPQLVVMRVKMPAEMVWLIDDYRAVIESYLNQRDQSGMARSLPGMAPLDADRLVRNVTRKLDDLDQKRAAFGLAHPVSSGTGSRTGP